jgi:hypothetical protein
VFRYEFTLQIRINKLTRFKLSKTAAS